MEIAWAFNELDQILFIKLWHALLGYDVQDWSLRCSSSAIWPFKTQPQIENEDVTRSSQCNLPTTRTKKCRALSLQVELDGWFLILHIILETCTRLFMRKFNMSFVFHFYILGFTYWIWTNPITKRVEVWEPFKMKLICPFTRWPIMQKVWGLQSWTLLGSYYHSKAESTMALSHDMEQSQQTIFTTYEATISLSLLANYTIKAKFQSYYLSLCYHECKTSLLKGVYLFFFSKWFFSTSHLEIY